MASCAMPGGCDDPDCYLCSIVAQLDQPKDHREHMQKGDVGTRDGDPKLAAERKRANLAFQKRHRIGPHR